MVAVTVPLEAAKLEHLRVTSMVGQTEFSKVDQ